MGPSILWGCCQLTDTGKITGLQTVAHKQDKSEGFDSCDRPSNLKLGFKSSIFQPMWPWNLMDDLEKPIGQFFYTMSSFGNHFKSSGEFKLKLQSGHAKFGSKLTIFCPVWTWNLMGQFDAVKLELQSRNAQFGSKSAIFCPVWPWNLTGDLEKQ